MNPGPKPSYLSVLIVFAFGVASGLGAWQVLLAGGDFAAGAKTPATSLSLVSAIGAAGLAAVIGCIGMLMRRPWGFWLAAAGLIVLGGIKIWAIALNGSTLNRWVYVAAHLYWAWECIARARGVFDQDNPPVLRTPADIQRALMTANYGGSQPGTSTGRSVPPAGNGRIGTDTSRQSQSLAHLDTGVFAPLSDEEIKRRVERAGTGGSWFQMLGMRGRIPPVSDERTLLIDKALVAHGLLTPEDLAEIHEVGDEYERLRPSIITRQAAENTAVQKALADDAAARAASREEKKAESAARKAAHVKAVAARRATDIVFLGRGVSGGLADRRANVERLAEFGLPVLTSPADIAKALGLTIPRLRWLAFHSEASVVSHYVRFTIAKKSGGTRELAAPHHDMAAAQQWVLINILDRLPVRECAHGFIRGRSVMSNAVPHVRRDAVVNADLKDFFPTITFPRVRGLFEGLGYSPAAATILALICTECPRRLVEYDGKKLHVATGPRGLPQGACTSPALSNIAARKLDARLSGLAEKAGWTYTRYADDLTFSANGDTAKQCGRLLAALRHICGEEGFTVNEKKTRVQRQNTQQTVTGIVVNHRPNVSRALHRRLRAILHNARTTGLSAQNTENHPNFPMWVRGMISWVTMANPDKGRKLRQALEGLKN